MSGLADMYDLKDEKQAKEYIEKVGIEYRFQCYKENLPDGCHRLGTYLEGFKKEYEKAKKVYTLNCHEHNYGRSCYKVGNFNIIGRGGEKNSEEAYKFFQKGCDAEYGPACYNGAIWNVDNKLSIKNVPKVMEFLEKGCNFGDLKSCHLLSSFYIAGDKMGVPQNFEKAFHIASKACDKGQKFSCINLSIMYKNGQGVKQDLALAKKYEARAKELHGDETEYRRTLTFGN